MLDLGTTYLAALERDPDALTESGEEVGGGFVGAAESKAMLAADSRGVPFVIMQGRRGGSAMAAAAVNALATEVE